MVPCFFYRGIICLTSGSTFQSVSVSFYHILIILWLLSYFPSKEDVPYLPRSILASALELSPRSPGSFGVENSLQKPRPGLYRAPCCWTVIASGTSAYPRPWVHVDISSSHSSQGSFYVFCFHVGSSDDEKPAIPFPLCSYLSAPSPGMSPVSLPHSDAFLPGLCPTRPHPSSPGCRTPCRPGQDSQTPTLWEEKQLKRLCARQSYISRVRTRRRPTQINKTESVLPVDHLKELLEEALCR